MRAPSAARSSSGTSPASVRATRGGPGQRHPAARASPARTAPTRPPPPRGRSGGRPASTTTPVSVRAAGHAAPSSSAPRCTSGRIRPRRRRRRAPPARRAGTGCTSPGSSTSTTWSSGEPDQAAAGAHQQDARRTRAHRAAIRPSSSPTRSAIRPTGSTWLAPTGLDRRVRHAVDRRALAILRDPDAAGVTDLAQPLGPVAAEAGQHHADGPRPEDPGDAAEQRIGGGPHAPDRRLLIQLEMQTIGAGDDAHVIVPRGHVRGVRQERRTVLRLDHAQPALRREPFGQAPGELRRHVLHDQYRGLLAGRQRRHHLRQRARARRWRRRWRRIAARGPGARTAPACGHRAWAAPAPAS